MELPYGTMQDAEMKAMRIQDLSDDGLMFLWVTGRAMELGRELFNYWGFVLKTTSNGSLTLKVPLKWSQLLEVVIKRVFTDTKDVMN